VAELRDSLHEGLGWSLEGSFGGLVFGVDEVGRGPWAGPVVAAAACLSPDAVPAGLADSKLLSPARRESIAARLPDVCIAEASVEEIDRLNIRAATLLAMARAVAALAQRLGPPRMVLVDGNVLPALAFPARAIVRGDGSIACIAAASIVAKVARDRLMCSLATEHPGYGWQRNKGYGTAEHAAGLESHGLTPHHRRSFSPIAKLAT
jgi:ribonuclease HII